MAATAPLEEIREPMPRERMVSAAEIARLLGVSGAWVRRHAEAGDLPAYKLGSTWRFRVSEIEAWAEAHRIDRDES